MREISMLLVTGNKQPETNMYPIRKTKGSRSYPGAVLASPEQTIHHNNVFLQFSSSLSMSYYSISFWHFSAV